LAVLHKFKEGKGHFLGGIFAKRKTIAFGMTCMGYQRIKIRCELQNMGWNRRGSV
jgi:hypothetical protein